MGAQNTQCLKKSPKYFVTPQMQKNMLNSMAENSKNDEDMAFQN